MRRRWFPYAAIGAAALASPLFWLVFRARVSSIQETVPPACFGLGFGCTLSPGDAAFVATVIYLLALGAVAVLAGLSELAGSSPTVVRSVVILGSIGALWIAVLLIGPRALGR